MPTMASSRATAAKPISRTISLPSRLVFPAEEIFELGPALAVGIFDKYFDLKEEVRRILQPTPQDKLERQIRGVLKTVTSQGKLDVQKTARMIVKVLRDAGSI